MTFWENLISRSSLLFILLIGGEFRILAADQVMFERVPATPALDSLPATDLSIKRGRFVRLTSAVPRSRSDTQPVDAGLRVNLFDDHEFQLSVSEQHSTVSGGYVFRGKIGDVPWSTGLFVCQNGVMAGVVNIPGEGAFKIQYVGNGIHQIIELDPSNMGRCGVDLMPEGFSVPVKKNVDSAPAPDGSPVESESRPMTSLDGLPAVQGEDPAIVDIMIVYTEASKEGAGGQDGIETLAQLAVEESNLCFANSGINMELNLVHVGLANYSETGNIYADLANLSNGTIRDLANLRGAQYKADLVSMITEREDSGTIAGLADVLSDVNYSGNSEVTVFSVVRRLFAVGNYTFPHEIAHNLGCAHDVANVNGNDGAFPYSYGERFVAQGVTHATVMTYPPGVRIPYFSNPNISYNGTPTGVAGVTDNAATINFTSANVVSKYRAASRHYLFGDIQFSGNEGSGAVTVTVRRTGISAGGMSVRYATADGSALAGQDYVATNGTLVFQTDEMEKSFTVNLINDSVNELPEMFTVHLSNPEPTFDSALGAPDSATVVIEDDESSFFAQVDRVSVFENVGQAGVMVVRGGPTNTTASISYSLVNMTAIAGEDFVDDSGLITFHPGERMKTLTFTLLNDFNAEPEEEFRLQLLNPSAGTALIEPSTITVKVIDDDRPGALVSHADGSGDLNDTVYAVKAQPDGKLLVAGSFSRIGGKPQAGIARLSPDGTVDSSFDVGTGVGGSVFAVDLLPDGRVVVAGDFGSVNGVARNYIALLGEDGSLDESFDPGDGANNWIRGIAIDQEGRILIGGLFTIYNGTVRNRLARVEQDGSLDASFDAGSGPNDMVRSIAVDADGRIVFAGDFTQVNGQSRGYYGRLQADGNWDPSFNQSSGANSRVRAVALQGDGGVLLGGHFTSLDGHSAKYVGRLAPDGSYDATFSTVNGPDNFVHGLVGDPWDNGVVIGGNFTAVGGINRHRIAKLTVAGSLDPGFDPGSGANALVWSVDTDTSGRVHLGGEFTMVNDESRLRVATLRVTANQDVFEPVLSPLSPGDLAAGQVRLNFSARPGVDYALDYAHDLTGAWTPIVTNTAAGDSMELVDSNPPPDRRYYRIRRVN